MYIFEAKFKDLVWRYQIWEENAELKWVSVESGNWWLS